MDSHVAQLVEMGFDARAATAALHDSPRFEDALNFLMTNPAWLPGALHATASTPGNAVVAYEASVPRVVAGTYFEISVQSRGQEWTVQKKIVQFEELHKEIMEMFAREMEGVTPFPQPGMFTSREDPALLESRRVYADEFLTIAAHSDTLCEYEPLLRFLGIMEHIFEQDGVSGRHESEAGYEPVSRGSGPARSSGVELQDMGDPWSTGSGSPGGGARGRGSSGAGFESRPASPPRAGGGGGSGGGEPASADMMKVAVFGAGAVGSLVGAFLARQIQQGVGRIQLTLFARGEHLMELKMNGLVTVYFRQKRWNFYKNKGFLNEIVDFTVGEPPWRRAVCRPGRSIRILHGRQHDQRCRAAGLRHSSDTWPRAHARQLRDCVPARAGYYGRNAPERPAVLDVLRLARPDAE